MIKALALRTAAAYAGGLLLVLVLASAGAVWPVFTIALAAELAVLMLALLAPEWAFAVAIALYGTEGWLKGQLLVSGMPIRAHQIAIGAAMLDLALVVSVVALAVSDRGHGLRLLWGRLDRLAKAGLILLGAWLVLSLAQILQAASLARGVDGFRLTQGAFVVAAIGGALLFCRSNSTAAARALLIALGAVAIYAVCRGVIGPSATERWFALTRNGTTNYGGVFRTVGSFSGAVGLASYVVPAGGFAFGLALLSRRYRALGIAVFVASAAAVVMSYSRSAVIGLGLGVLVATAIGLRTVFSTPRRRRVAVVAIVGLLAVGAGAVVLASRASPVTQARARGLLHPFGDKSMQIRFHTWRESLQVVVHHPLGVGLGAVGGASGVAGGTVVTTDNSFLKIMREQGFEGVLLFASGLAALGAAILYGLRRLREQERAVAAAAIAGVVGFLAMCVFGEFIEQPGKVVAWALLGAAVAMLSRREARA